MRKALLTALLALLSPFSGLGVSPAAAQQTRLVLVEGLAGNDDYRERFRGWATALRDAAIERLGIAEANIVWLVPDPDARPGPLQGRSTLAELENVLTALSDAPPEDRVLVVLIGHGSEQRGEARFNLPGPDLDPAGLDRLLAPLAPRRVAVVNTAPSSAGFIPGLAAPGRTVITATRSGREQYETWFAEYFTAALAEEGADLDKDGSISLLEAFEYTRREVERHYASQNLLATEHPLIDDNGDGRGSLTADVDGEDGAVANAFLVGGAPARAAAAAAGSDPVLAALLRDKAALEERIAALRAERATLDAAEYDRRLEDLLVQLALKDREIRAHEEGP